MPAPTLPVRGRLAPSPTGGLHAGNVRTLLAAWLSARAAGGAVILRIEDIDRARCRPEHTAQLLDDLRWLGLDWDEGPQTGGPHAPYLQSERLARYDEVLARLQHAGRAYPCVCSRAELAQAASAPHGSGGPAYPGTCRGRFYDAGAARAHAGRSPSWRFDARAAGVERLPWRDAFRPEQDQPDVVDDFVLWRADGVPSYQLAVVTDDLAMAVSEVVRGDDLADSTPRQLALIGALGGTAPIYRHLPLVLDEHGVRLAKRAGATQVAWLRAAGVTAERLLGFLACGLGLLPDPAPTPAAELVTRFSWDAVSRKPVVIAEATLRALVD